MSNKTSEKKSSPAEKNKGVRITIKNTSEGSVKERPRIHTLDELRGFAVFCMIFFHAFYTIGFVFGQKWGVTLVDFFYPAEPYFAGLFIIISGIASNLSHSNLERGVKLALISLTVSIVSLMVLGQKGMIQFGILHFLSAAMIFYGLTNKYLRLIPSVLGIILNILLFILTYNITSHTIGLPYLFSFTLPDSLYSTEYLFMLGFPNSKFYSSDYFPILQWLFLFIAGSSCSKSVFRPSPFLADIPCWYTLLISLLSLRFAMLFRVLYSRGTLSSASAAQFSDLISLQA